MQLITGGLGFVGSNTAQALLQLDADCVLTQHRKGRVPEFLRDQVGKMYGPNYDATRGLFIGRLVHAAVKGEKPNVEGLRFGSAYAADGGDQCYIKDAARGIALLQTADKLNHRLYNVSSGRATTNQDVVNAIKRVFPTLRLNFQPVICRACQKLSGILISQESMKILDLSRTLV